MQVRDKAKGAAYKIARNRVSCLVKWDRLLSNLDRLAASGDSLKVLWEIANAAIGKSMPHLPPSVSDAAGKMTRGPLAAAMALNV
jgi:hypothetical protein